MNIKLYSKNAKLHPDSQLQKIALSLRTYGWRQPIIVDSNFEIIVGHGRYLAYEKYPEGIKQPWIVNDKGETISGGPEEKPLTNEEVRAYRLMDNKSNESQWDMDLVTVELKTLEDLGFDIQLSGFDNFATDTVYAGGDNRYFFAKSLYDQHPDVVKIVQRFNRWHHQVDYRPFEHNKLKKREDLDLKGEVNNYGLELKTV